MPCSTLSRYQPLPSAACSYLESVRRYNYTTPKSYLELISLYKALLAQKRAELKANKERLESGVEKIAQASAQVVRLPDPSLLRVSAIFVLNGFPGAQAYGCSVQLGAKSSLSWRMRLERTAHASQA